MEKEMSQQEIKRLYELVPHALTKAGYKDVSWDLPSKTSEGCVYFTVPCDEGLELSAGQLCAISESLGESRDPMTVFGDEMYETECSANEDLIDAWDFAFFDFVFSDLLRAVSDEDDRNFLMERKEYVRDILARGCSATFDWNSTLDTEHPVCLMLATEEEMDQDMSSYCSLNYCGDDIDCDCALFEVADAIGERQSLTNALILAKSEESDWKDAYGDKLFVSSCIEELENLPCCMGGFTILVRMPLRDYLHLLTMMKEKKESSYIRIPDNATCGIYNPWSGSGSIMGVEFPCSVPISTSLIRDAWIADTGYWNLLYDINSVYGFTNDAWKPLRKNSRYRAFSDENVETERRVANV